MADSGGDRRAEATTMLQRALAADAPELQAHPISQAATDYSPLSNPYGERPPYRTSAGVAASMSTPSDLPAPATPLSAGTRGDGAAAADPATPAASDNGSNVMTPDRRGAGVAAGAETPESALHVWRQPRCERHGRQHHQAPRWRRRPPPQPRGPRGAAARGPCSGRPGRGARPCARSFGGSSRAQQRRRPSPRRHRRAAGL